ncbi:hypothetical protein FACS1894172_03330 [Spirochaetia bacterium]|nr:hypothetical protein FACS1894172_03330 [Spirochaetia bacterium]
MDILASIRDFKDSPYKELEDVFQISFEEIISAFLDIELILKPYITIPGVGNNELIGAINPETKILESPYFYNSYIPQSSEIELDKKNMPFKNKVVEHLFLEYPQFQNHFEFMKGKYFEETPDGFLEWKKSWVTLPQYFNWIKPITKKLNDWIVVGEAFKRPAQVIKRDFASNNKKDSRDFIKLKEDFSKNYNPDGI